MVKTLTRARVHPADGHHAVFFFSANSPMIVITDLRLVSDYQLELSAHNLFYHRSALLWFILGHWVSNKPPLTVPGWRRTACREDYLTYLAQPDICCNVYVLLALSGERWI